MMDLGERMDMSPDVKSRFRAARQLAAMIHARDEHEETDAEEMLRQLPRPTAPGDPSTLGDLHHLGITLLAVSHQTGRATDQVAASLQVLRDEVHELHVRQTTIPEAIAAGEGAAQREIGGKVDALASQVAALSASVSDLGRVLERHQTWHDGYRDAAIDTGETPTVPKDGSRRPLMRPTVIGAGAGAAAVGLLELVRVVISMLTGA